MLNRSGSLLGGIQHRFISMFPGLVCLLAMCLGYGLSGESSDIPPMVGALLLTVLGYLSPVILTEGLNKPIPSGAHLELGSKRIRIGLLVIGMGLLVAPGVFRLATRIFGAA